MSETETEWRDYESWTDDELIHAIVLREHSIRTAQDALATFNAEWLRRHAVGACVADCREPGAYTR